MTLIEKSTLLNLLTTEEISSYQNDGSIKTVNYNQNEIVLLAGEECVKLENTLSGHIVVERIDESGHLMTLAEFPLS
ncbi:MAG: hypothetical protein GX050_03630 [Firmicutes bacterium]|nr:hypothetical protein [Bacillota bacterium]